MSFNVTKCSIICFNQKQSVPVADYTLGEAKHLEVIIQSDLKFTTHIKQKVAQAKQQLGMIKRALHDATKKAKLLAYTALCRPLVEYASSVWVPVLEYQIYDIEMVQHRAVRFICDLKGRVSISPAIEKIELDNLRVNAVKKPTQLVVSFLQFRLINYNVGSSNCA